MEQVQSSFAWNGFPFISTEVLVHTGILPKQNNGDILITQDNTHFADLKVTPIPEYIWVADSENDISFALSCLILGIQHYVSGWFKQLAIHEEAA